MAERYHCHCREYENEFGVASRTVFRLTVSDVVCIGGITGGSVDLASASEVVVRAITSVISVEASRLSPLTSLRSGRVCHRTDACTCVELCLSLVVTDVDLSFSRAVQFVEFCVGLTMGSGAHNFEQHEWTCKMFTTQRLGFCFQLGTRKNVTHFELLARSVKSLV